MNRRFVNANYDAPVEIHMAIRRICDDNLIKTGEKKRIPELYQDLILYGLANIKKGDSIQVSNLSGNVVKTIFYLDREHRNQIDSLFENSVDMNMREKYDIILEYSLKKLYDIDL
jgi:hypothetical protein